MAYKLLYIEDLDPSSIIADLNEEDFEVEHCNPEIFEEVIKLVNQAAFDAVLIDFRLTSGKAVFDAPTIAQTARTKSSKESSDGKRIRHFPIFLISEEKNISDYYDDITSNDLFDLSVSKETFRKELKKYSERFKATIDAYKKIEESKFAIEEILDISGKGIEIDYRFISKFNDEHIKHNTYFFSKFTYNYFVRSVGPLIGEQILAARLGVSTKTEGWQKLKEALNHTKYTGIFSRAYDRWWALQIEKFCEDKLGIKSLRRLNASQRLEILDKAGFKDLKVAEVLQFSESSNFWTICRELNAPIDPIDGLELAKKELLQWQEKEFISILAAFQTSDLYKYVKPVDKARFNEIKKEAK